MTAVSRISESNSVATKAFMQLAAAADNFERYENAHATRIAKIADEIAAVFHLAPQDRLSLRTAAFMHDLGEVAMEREYIVRPRKLNDDERLDLFRHPVIGEQEAARAGADRVVQLLVRWHHEWWNGSGYPDGLRQKQIPLAARILRLADTYAALTDARPYRAAFTEDEAKEKIVSAAAIEFDPRVVLAFLSLAPLEELHSFATAEKIVDSTKGDWMPFSSFMG